MSIQRFAPLEEVFERVDGPDGWNWTAGEYSLLANYDEIMNQLTLRLRGLPDGEQVVRERVENPPPSDTEVRRIATDFLLSLQEDF